LRKLGEDVSEMLEYMPASFFVIRVKGGVKGNQCGGVIGSQW
jgi:hypothetical protein